MTDSDHDLEARLARLGQATRGLRPTPGFERRVLGAVALEPGPGWLSSLARSGRMALVAASLAAAAAFALAAHSDARYASAVAAGDDVMELDW